eukprot:Gb_37253 [translate_table: standard]
MAQPLNNQKSKTFLFLGLLLRPHSLKTRGNANNSSFENVTRLWKQSQLKEALNILYVGNQCVGSHTYAWLLQDCITKKALFDGKLVHAHIIQNGFKWEEIIVGNSLATIYAKCGNMVDARRVLDQMPERDVVSWTAMIAAYARNGFAEDALTLFYQMQLTGIQPNQFTFASVLPACVNSAVLKGVHEEIIKSGLQFNVFVGNALVDVYAKAGNVENARDLFDKMPQRNVVSWNSMIAGYAQKGQVDEAMKLFQKMPERNVVSWTTVIAGYAQNGFGEEAQKLFRQMQMAYVKPNSKTFAIVLPACASLAALKHGEEIHGHIIRSGILSDPNAQTFTVVLPACANLAALQQGKEVHEIIIKTGFQNNLFVDSALVDMYAKCGSIENAHAVFDKMTQQGIASWNAMILAYATHSCCREALHFFDKMQQSGTNPDQITFIGVLSACCHAGLVDEGWQYFYCMSQYYHITPAIEHYGCMVDLLGRAGHLDEALGFINKMPIKPDATVWGCLLGACRIHANVELGECVAERIFELDSKSAAPYVLLSNIYAAAGRWNDIEKVRKMMKDRGVNKKPGCSWIEVNKQVHAFFTGDRSHLQREKLATSFRLINTSPGTAIRIIKNL